MISCWWLDKKKFVINKRRQQVDFFHRLDFDSKWKQENSLRSAEEKKKHENETDGSNLFILTEEIVLIDGLT